MAPGISDTPVVHRAHSEDDDDNDGLLAPLAPHPASLSAHAAPPAFKKLARLNAVVRRFNVRSVASPLPDPINNFDDDGRAAAAAADDKNDDPVVTSTAVDYWSSHEVETRQEKAFASSAEYVSHEPRVQEHTSEDTTVDVKVSPDVPPLHTDSESEMEETTTIDYFSRKEVLLEDLYETLPGITLTMPEESPVAEAPAAVTGQTAPFERPPSPSPLGRRSRRTATTTTTTTTTSRSRSRSRDGRTVGLTVRKTTRKVTTVVIASDEQEDGENDLFYDADDAAWADIADEASPAVPLRRPTTVRRRSTLLRPQTLARRDSALPTRRMTRVLLDPSAAAVRRGSTLRRSFQVGGVSDLEDEDDDFMDALETLSATSGRSRVSSSVGLRRRTMRRRPTLVRVPTRCSTVVDSSARTTTLNTSTTTTTTTRKRLVVTTSARRRRHKPKPRTFFSTLCSRTGESLAHVATAATLASRPLGMLGVVDPGLVATAGAIAHAAGTNLVARFGRRDTQMRVQAVEGAAGAVSAAGVLERCGVGGWVGKTLGSGLEAAMDGGVVAGVGGLLASGIAMKMSQAHSGYLSAAAEAIGHFGNCASLLPPEFQRVANAAGVMSTVLGGVGDDSKGDGAEKAICAPGSDYGEEEHGDDSDRSSEHEGEEEAPEGEKAPGQIMD
ncbi:hypothetical protein HDU87_004074 [Geranomyces variabilis]|uniref:Uncharacterized protein n=1 Tax=Geranomyces variabilis TaxID=109894 RepID=A0AAD5TVU3_9FUNG|nr:hypothetical protein HDU87_004074 [Geranomyces variabilis]